MRFAITEMFPGLGTLTDPFARGLRKHGEVTINAGLELDARYLALFSRQHPEASTANGDVTAYAPEETCFPVDADCRILVAGIPCTGASRAGRSKNAIEAPEAHPKVGHLFIPFLHHVRRFAYDLCVLENVPEYQTSFSAERIRESLAALRYQITEYVINPYSEFATPTERRRWVLIASRKAPFNWNYRPEAFAGTLGQYLDAPGPQDADDEMTPEQVAADKKYIDRKASEGCGFRMRLIDAAATKCPTICRSYGKRQPSATFVRTANSYRMLRPREVARLHRHSSLIEHTIATLPATLAYEVLGQGVVAPPFESLGDHLGAFATHGGMTEEPIRNGQFEFALTA
ncbi:MAG: DNA cytosine methyltransferase [Opitutaceae bacterium]|nr:DNA cytosine methyltransferase [Opitutaceae bacterium]